MREDFEKLDKDEKKRIIIFMVVTLASAVFAIAYAWEWCGLFKEQLIDTKDMDVSVDGADFNWFFMPLATGLNSFLMMISEVFYEIFLILFNLLFYGLLGLIALRKVDHIREEEYKLTKQIFKIAVIASTVISVIITKFNLLLSVALFMLPMVLLGNLLYLWPLKNRRGSMEN